MAIYSKLRKLLLDAGLSEAESLLYIELLKKPAQNIWELVSRTKMSKTSVYRAFEKLLGLGIVERTQNQIKALSLKSLVSGLSTSSRKLGKTADRIRAIAPFLRVPQESVTEIETFYTPEQITDAYIFMSEQDYDINFDFGDFENFSHVVGGLLTTHKFRDNRVKHATNVAICTTFGPHTESFCTREAKVKFRNFVEYADLGFEGAFNIFSDRSDYVLFNYFKDREDPRSVLVKSKAVADIQRRQFDLFSRMHGNS